MLNASAQKIVTAPRRAAGCRWRCQHLRLQGLCPTKKAGSSVLIHVRPSQAVQKFQGSPAHRRDIFTVCISTLTRWRINRTEDISDAWRSPPKRQASSFDAPAERLLPIGRLPNEQRNITTDYARNCAQINSWSYTLPPSKRWVLTTKAAQSRKN